MTGRRIATLVVASLVHFGAHAQLGKPVVQADVSRLGDTAHLELRGLKNWRYDLRKDGSKIILTIPAVDMASVSKLRGFTDPLIKSVQVDQSGPDGNFIVTFALASDDIESFDYLTDDPSRLIVDFYRKPQEVQPAANESKKAPAKVRRNPSAVTGKKLPKGDYKTADRRPAGDEFLSVDPKKASNVDINTRFGLFDGGDDNYDRFRIKEYEIRDDAVIASRQNIYLPFPILQMNVSQLAKLMEEIPEYVIKAKDTRENKEARLLLTLFQRQRDAVFLKTYDYFRKKYPESEYNEIIKNVAAHVYLRRWRESGGSGDFEEARALYSELIQKFPDSPLREYCYLTLGYAQMERGEALSTLQTFQNFLKSYPASPEVPQIRKAVAEALMLLKKYDEAAEQYLAIIKDFPKTDHAKEATYRLGDVEFSKGDLSKSISLYEKAIKDLPAQEKVFPNANFNMAEARFWQKDYRKSLNNYVQFVNLYPTHEHGGYALTRIGELLGILGADQRRVMGAFLESYFRFPNHPGAKVARIRMLSQQMRTMKPKELKKSLEEINQFAENLKIPGIRQFTTLMVAEGLTNRGENIEAMNYLISYYQKNPDVANRDVFKSRILRNISNEMQKLVNAGDFLKTLSFHSKYSSTWLKNSDRIDVPYFLGGAFEKAGAFPEAQKIYAEALARRSAIAGTVEEKEKKVQEHLPSAASLNLRLAATLAEERKYLEAFNRLKAIDNAAELSDPEKVERIQLSAKIFDLRNEGDKARAALLELAGKWQGDPVLVAPVNLQLAQNFMKSGDPKQAEHHATKVLEAEGGETPFPDQLIADALSVQGDALLAQKRGLSAVDSYQKLLERFEDKMPLSTIRYKVGEILFERGDLNGAAEVWKRLEGTPNEFLAKIGREKIEDSKWKGDYNKYINRIPTMSSQKTGKKQESKQ